MYDYVILASGLVVLLIGGDFLVRGAVGLAERFNIPPLIIGLTIVSFGTSAPEFFVSVEAAWDGQGGLAVGNVVGSNIANVLLVLGLPAIILSTSCREEGIGRNILVMLGLSAVFIIMLLKGSLERYDGLILIALLALFLWDQYKSALQARSSVERDLDYHEEVHHIPSSLAKSAALAIAGLVMLPIGGRLIVVSATGIAESMGVSSEIVGLSIVAIGTSLPELAASLMAVFRGKSSVALGNIVGSNIFNIAAIMGITAAIVPMEFGPHILLVDVWIMLASSLLLGALAHYHVVIGKVGGIAMVGFYTMYLVTVFW